MNKQQLIERTVNKLNGEASKAQVGKTLDALLEVLGEELAAGQEIPLMGFGKFEVKIRSARNGTHPGTGEKITIPEKKTVGFKPFKPLLEKLGNQT